MMHKGKDAKNAQAVVIRLHKEDLSIAKQQLITGRVQVSTTTHQHEHFVDEFLACESIEIERVPVGQTVDSVPEVRQEGDTLIIPVVEEVLVVERRLLLKEEVRVRRVRTTRRHRERVPLRRQQAVITRQRPPAQRTSREDHSEQEP
jgi:uncharacterized protein (TIGR02271 family)